LSAIREPSSVRPYHGPVKLCEFADAWYSGKHRDFGANIQAIIRLDGLPIWTTYAEPGRRHDLTCAQQQGVTATLNWAAAELDLPTLADAGYDGAGKANAASRFPTAAGKHSGTPPPVPAESVTCAPEAAVLGAKVPRLAAGTLVASLPVYASEGPGTGGDPVASLFLTGTPPHARSSWFPQ
jgi:hypothetical protein